MAPMDQSSATDERLMALEIKAAYAEDLLDQLNDQVFQQQRRIDALLHELHALRERMPEAGSTPRSLRDDIPPHY